jgi:hypothetical protein
MPVPSQGHYGFSSFQLLTDFVCLYTYEFLLSLWKIGGGWNIYREPSPSTTTSPLKYFNYESKCQKHSYVTHWQQISLTLLLTPYLYTFSLYENPSFSIVSAGLLFYLFCSSIVITTVIVTAGTFERNESGRFDAVKSNSIHYFFGNACTKSGSLRFFQFPVVDSICVVFVLFVLYHVSVGHCIVCPSASNYAFDIFELFLAKYLRHVFACKNIYNVIANKCGSDNDSRNL